jgi:hypothetical protein
MESMCTTTMETACAPLTPRASQHKYRGGEQPVPASRLAAQINPAPHLAGARAIASPIPSDAIGAGGKEE